MERLRISTRTRCEMIDITSRVQEVVQRSGVKSGICTIFVPHTTAGCAVNEHADPDVAADILKTLGELIPQAGSYRHVEGNSDAHIKSTWCGVSESLIIEDGQLQLGRWQGVFFCEFDGPRSREVWIKIVGT
jgi:secondary thiamine-phosphate synthase enzyme